MDQRSRMGETNQTLAKEKPDLKYNRVFLFSVNYPGGFYKGGDTPELGLGYLCEVLEKENIEHEYVDMNLGYDLQFLLNRIGEFKPHIIGVGMKSFAKEHNYSILMEIRKRFPGIKILVGGTHISIFGKKALEECEAIDFGVLREGEEVLIEICKGKELSSIKGLYYRDNGIQFTGVRISSLELDLLPFPKYKKFELEKYWYPARYMLTSRGCPEKCTFCSVPTVMGQYWRARSPQHVVEEIRYWHDRGYRRFEIIDDNFTLDQERAERICDLIINENMRIEIDTPNGIRADRTNLRLLRKMKSAGWKSVSFGVEGNEHALQLVRKGETMEQIELGIQNSLRAGLDVILHFIMGIPGQTEEDIRESFSLSLRYPIHAAIFNICMPYPGTELFQIVKEKNLLFESAEEYMDKLDKKHGVAVIRNKDINDETWKILVKEAAHVQKEVKRRVYMRVMRKRKLGSVPAFLYGKGLIPENVLKLAMNTAKRVKKDKRVPFKVERR